MFLEMERIFMAVYIKHLCHGWVKIFNSGIPEEYVEKVVETIFMTDNLNPLLEEITAEISKISEWCYIGGGANDTKDSPPW